jgi:cation diffusion facilitator family transporter
MSSHSPLDPHVHNHNTGHEHNDKHDSDHEHPHPHSHGEGHAHAHPAGIKGFFTKVFVPHSHDPADSVDDALEASTQGIRAVKISLVVLALTALLQLVVVVISGSVALLADTIHNFSDALTAVPLWIAFVLGRRVATQRYTHGFGRAEDLAGLFIVAMIGLSALVAGVESIRRLFDPQPVSNLGWVLAAGVIGFLGNEAVAMYRIRVGRRIGSAALVADGMHARTDGFTSLAVIVGAIGVMLGFPLADPIVGLVITAAILVLLWSTARDVGRRLMDGVDPSLVAVADRALRATDGVTDVTEIKLRWSGHRLNVNARVAISPESTVESFHTTEHLADHALRQALPSVGQVQVSPAPPSEHRPHP